MERSGAERSGAGRAAGDPAAASLRGGGRPLTATSDRAAGRRLGAQGLQTPFLSPFFPPFLFIFFSFFPIEKVFASLPQVERGVSKIIGGDPKGNNFLYTNGKCVVIRNIDVTYPSAFI